MIRSASVLAALLLAASAQASPPSAEAVVAAQLAAYNRGDAAAFAATYAVGAEIFDPARGSAPIVAGRDAIRSRYAAQFARLPGQQARIVRRIVSGRYVVDHEALPGTGLEAIVVYEVRDGLILRAWLHRSAPE